MTTEFEERMKELHKEFENLSPEERKAVKQKIKRINVLTSRKLERMKHDLLRNRKPSVHSLWLDGESQELSKKLEIGLLIRKESS